MATVQVSLAGAMGPPGTTIAVSTVGRPAPATRAAGEAFYDTTLNKPIWVNAAKNGYVDATGASV